MLRRCLLLILLALAPDAVLAQASDQNETAAKAWAALLQGMAQIAKYVETGELSSVHSEDMPMTVATSVLLSEAEPVPAAGAGGPTPGSLVAFARTVNELHAAADEFDQRKTEELLARLLADYQSLRARSRESVFAAAEVLAARHTCPMHPEVVGRSTERCPKCGMDLDQPVRIPLNAMGGEPVRQTIRARIETAAPPRPGQRVDAILELSSFGRPVEVTDLRVVHTEKIHLLVIDPTLTDYHHIHPEPTPTPGQYRFSFTPRKAGSYRAWADVRSTATGFQEYAMADITSDAAGGVILNKEINLRTDVGGLRLELALEGPGLRAAEATRARVRIVDSDGRPFTALEPVMGAFAHIVGFAEDFTSVLHTHPLERRLVRSSDRGGPDLEFQVYPTQSGFYRLFVQIQTGGESVFAPFGVFVSPGAPER